MEIYILSSGRANRQPTWDTLPLPIQQHTKLVVPWEERAAYEKHYPIYTSPIVVRDVAKARQWLANTVPEKMLMLDDDLTFATRRVDNPTRFNNATPAEIEETVAHIFTLLTDYAHVGMASREGGNRNIQRFAHNTRMTRVLAYDCDVLRRHKIRFDAMPLMEDFHVTLSLLRKGHDNCLVNYMVHNQYGSNTAGGCSQYRTPALQSLAANLLYEHHPAFVKVVKKQTKTAWGGQSRDDVIVQWKRALGADL